MSVSEAELDFKYALTGFVNPENIIISGFSNPVATKKYGFPNTGYVIFNIYLSNPFLTMLHNFAIRIFSIIRIC